MSVCFIVSCLIVPIRLVGRTEPDHCLCCLIETLQSCPLRPMRGSIAAPIAAPSGFFVATRGLPRTSAFIWHQNGDFVEPPTMRTLEQSIPISSNLSTLSLRPKEMPLEYGTRHVVERVVERRPVNVPCVLPFQLGGHCTAHAWQEGWYRSSRSGCALPECS